jgi:hypothetical protein
VIERVPKQVAEAHGIVPIRVEGREVEVCLADPQNLSRLDEIAFTLGCRIKPFLATELVIERALARYYSKAPDVWDEALNRSGEWRVEQTGSWRMPLVENPPPLPVVEAEVARTDFTRTQPAMPVPSLARDSRAEPLPPAPQGSNDPYERLASVMSRSDLIAAMGSFFGHHFASFCLLEIVPGGTRCASLRRDGQPAPVPEQPQPMAVDGAGWLRELLAHPQVILRQKVSDQHLRELLEGLGLRSTQVAVVPVFDYGRLRFVLLGQGLTADEVKAIFGELKPYLTTVSEALRMISLRELIRKRARRPAAPL